MSKIPSAAARHMASTGSVLLCDTLQVSPDSDESLPRCRHEGGVYYSPFGWKPKTAKEMLQFGFCYRQNQLQLGLEDNRSLIKSRPLLLRAEGGEPRLGAPGSQQTSASEMTWLGHACVLWSAGGLNFLTDPVFSGRCSPSQWAGPQRFTRVPEGTERLQVDVILLSHTHYDHLDNDTVRKYGGTDGPLWVCPVGVKALLTRLGVLNVVELDWWDSLEYADGRGRLARITFTPAAHWTNRGLLDINTCLWGSFCVRTNPPDNAATRSNNSSSFYFSGDTAYDEALFKTIGAKLGPFDAAAIGVGAYV
jgi:L-ascorbate metabolism protein UlaG (beta-lactamase superfamily)